MKILGRLSTSVFLCILAILAPSAVMAQTTGITGRITDASGAVLPGVSVEVSSPALIERLRTTVTDSDGRYAVIDLRPGEYAVTLSLAGFTTVKRQGIQLTAGFTATVNGQLEVGSVEETLTVTGGAPTVDLRSTATTTTVTRDVLDAVPVARNYSGIGQTIAGTIPTTPNRASGQDVGGMSGERGSLSYHGSNGFSEMMPQLEGMSWFLDGGGQTYTINPAEVQEFQYELSSHASDTTYGGVRINVVPKDGGNRTSVYFRGNYTNENLQSDNLSDELISKGLKSVNRQRYSGDVNLALGGAILKDKLWYYASGRYQTDSYFVAGLNQPIDPLSFTYVGDPSNPAFDEQWITSTSGRLTWQATEKNKFSAYFATQPYCQCYQFIVATRAPQAAVRQTVDLNNLFQFSWKLPLTNRLLLSAGMMRAQRIYTSGFTPGVTSDIISATELSTGLLFRAPGTMNDANVISPTYRADVAYVTGSHTLKGGVEFLHLYSDSKTRVNQDINYSLRNGLPVQLTLNNSPRRLITQSNELGLFVQDQWIVSHFTVNAGLRYQGTRFDVLASTSPAGRFVPARNYPDASNVPNWKDVLPRFGVVYDLFGNGKTAVKASASKYLVRTAGGIAGAMAPVNRDVTTATRVWNDNGNFVPECDLLLPQANGECLALSNSQFGKPNALATNYDSELLSGSGVRSYSWEFTTGFQHELFAGTSLDVGYARRIYGNFTVTDNLAVTPTDYDPYCVAVPSNALLPDGGGNTLCGLYDLNPTKFGQVNNFVTFSDKYGTMKNHYNGIDATVTSRLPGRLYLSGGVSSGTMTGNNQSSVAAATVNSVNQCFVVDSPQQMLFCDQKLPWQTQVKGLATIGLPHEFDAAVTVQSLPGPMILAKQSVTSAQTIGLGRPLSAGLATIDLIRPGSVFGERMYQVDTKLTKRFTVNNVRLQGEIAVYNLFNNNTPLLYNQTFGPSWQVPTYILPARIVGFAFQASF